MFFAPVNGYLLTTSTRFNPFILVTLSRNGRGVVRCGLTTLAGSGVQGVPATWSGLFGVGRVYNMGKSSTGSFASMPITMAVRERSPGRAPAGFRILHNCDNCGVLQKTAVGAKQEE